MRCVICNKQYNPDSISRQIYEATDGEGPTEWVCDYCRRDIEDDATEDSWEDCDG